MRMLYYNLSPHPFRSFSLSFRTVTPCLMCHCGPSPSQCDYFHSKFCDTYYKEWLLHPPSFQSSLLSFVLFPFCIELMIVSTCVFYLMMKKTEDVCDLLANWKNEENGVWLMTYDSSYLYIRYSPPILIQKVKVKIYAMYGEASSGIFNKAVLYHCQEGEVKVGGANIRRCGICKSFKRYQLQMND